MAEGIGMAQAAIDAGQAADKLEALIRYTQANG
jgi:anthranilate phosphoribosyltransferase